MFNPVHQFSGAYTSNSVECPIYLLEKAIQTVHVEECWSFLEKWKKCFEQSPNLNKVSCSQAIASDPQISKIYVQIDGGICVYDTDDLNFSLPTLDATKTGRSTQTIRPTNLGNSPQTTRALLNYLLTADGNREDPCPTQSVYITDSMPMNKPEGTVSPSRCTSFFTHHVYSTVECQWIPCLCL
jgi:hypothetical protein